MQYKIRKWNKLLFVDEDAGFIYCDAVSMSILQIGELSKSLTDEIRQAYSDIPWREIIRMRDVAVHHYGAWNYEKVWGTSQNDVPALAEKVQRILETEPIMGA